MRCNCYLIWRKYVAFLVKTKFSNPQNLIDVGKFIITSIITFYELSKYLSWHSRMSKIRCEFIHISIPNYCMHIAQNIKYC